VAGARDVGLLFRDVVPPLEAIGRRARRAARPRDFYSNLGVHRDGDRASRSSSAASPGSPSASRSARTGSCRTRSRRSCSNLGPTPKIVFFPVMLMWFGVGAGSKIAMGVVSCFFPVAISARRGMREIDAVLIRVGRSFRASTWKMVTSIYLPAMRQPVVNGFRLGLGVAIIGTLLAETKLSNKGLGYLVIQAYATFDMPRMYALLIVLFVLSIGVNALIGRLGRGDRRAIA
jgi:ABC-type nitrate/sulfonate/bicarbonate transport system permease component